MARLTNAERADLAELVAIIDDAARFAVLMDNEAQVEDVLNSPHLAETMEAAILEHDKADEKPQSLLSALRSVGGNKRKARKPTGTVPAKRRKAQVVYSYKLVLNTEKELGAIRNGKGGLQEGNPSSKPIGIESYKAVDGGKAELAGRRMYSKVEIVAIQKLSDADSDRLSDIVNS
jgi:hypothetical protein